MSISSRDRPSAHRTTCSPRATSPSGGIGTRSSGGTAIAERAGIFAEEPAGAFAFGGRAEDHAVRDRAQMLERNGRGLPVPCLLRGLLRGAVDRELSRREHVEASRSLVGRGGVDELRRDVAHQRDARFFDRDGDLDAFARAAALDDAGDHLRERCGRCDDDVGPSAVPSFERRHGALGGDRGHGQTATRRPARVHHRVRHGAGDRVEVGVAQRVVHRQPDQPRGDVVRHRQRRAVRAAETLARGRRVQRHVVEHRVHAEIAQAVEHRGARRGVVEQQVVHVRVVRDVRRDRSGAARSPPLRARRSAGGSRPKSPAGARAGRARGRAVPTRTRRRSRWAGRTSRRRPSGTCRRCRAESSCGSCPSRG